MPFCCSASVEVGLVYERTCAQRGTNSLGSNIFVITCPAQKILGGHGQFPGHVPISPLKKRVA